MRSYKSVLFGKPFRATCIPPPPGRSWSTRDNEQMRAIMGEFEISRAWAPHPAFNGLVAEPAGELDITYLDAERTLVRSSLPLEGYEIPPDHALISAAGGCMFIVGLGRDPAGKLRMIAAHAGRDSLIDRNRMLRAYLDQPAYSEAPGAARRPFEGVLYAIVEAFRRWDISVHGLEVQGFYSLPASVFLHPLHHPKFGIWNRSMLECIQGRWGGKAAYKVEDSHEGPCVAVSVKELFLAQARELGIAYIGHHPDIDANGTLAHTRHPNPAMREKRNLVIIHRLA
jgi:hypothetical protein